MQSLVWERGDFTWCIQLPASLEAHAGVLFRSSRDLRWTQEPTALTFQMKPAYMAEHVTISFLGEVEMKNGVLRHHHSLDLVETLADFKRYTQGDWVNYHIPLEAFGSANTQWSGIRGIRIARTDSTGPGDPVILRRLTLQTAGSGGPPRYASLR